MSVRIAFNMANFVGHYSGYRFKLDHWMAQHALAAEKTSVEEWADLCRQVRACGFDAIEVWVALIERCENDEARSAAFVGSMKSSGLEPIALAGPLNDKTAWLCRRFGIPAVAGGYWGSDKATTLRLTRDTGIEFNYENHPEASVDAIRQQIDDGRDGFRVALDTGWLATQGVDAPAAVRQLGRLIRHVHVKDVRAVGGHETVRLGTGCVDIPAVFRELKAIGFDGVLSWEDEPENRNPLDIAAETHDYIEAEWAK